MPFLQNADSGNKAFAKTIPQDKGYACDTIHVARAAQFSYTFVLQGFTDNGYRRHGDMSVIVPLPYHRSGMVQTAVDPSPRRRLGRPRGRRDSPGSCRAEVEVLGIVLLTQVFPHNLFAIPKNRAYFFRSRVYKLLVCVTELISKETTMRTEILHVATVALVLAVCGSAIAGQQEGNEQTPKGLSLENALAMGEGEQGQADQPEPASEDLKLLPFLPKGFLTGLKGFDDFVHPVSSPIYFFDPFIDSYIEPLYVWHKFPDQCDLKGGDLNVWALQFSLALTERLQLTASCDGYSRIRARALRPDEGWNDLALGLKYNLLADVEDQFLLSTGLTWRLSNGHALTLHGGVDELNPYVTAAKAIGKFRTIGTIGGRLPMDRHKGNFILYENLHIAYKLFDNFFPLVEFNGVQYLSNADRLPLDVGGLDYANIGSNNVKGNSTFWGAVGFRWKVKKNIEVGTTYEYPISTAHNDIFDRRVTVSVILGL